MKRVAGILAAAAACLTVAAPANAAFPGRNGLIAYPSLTARPGALPVPAGLWMVRPGGSHRRPLVRSRAFLEQPAWSADGRRVAFARWPRDRYATSAKPSIYLATVARKSPRFLVYDGFSPTWSPDGGRIAFLRSAAGGTELWLLGLRDGTRTRIASGLLAVRAAWSPDGTRIAYGTEQAGYGEQDGAIWTVDPHGLAFRRVVSEHLASVDSLSWSPDGSALVYGLVSLRFDCSFGCSPTYSVLRVGRGGRARKVLAVPKGAYASVGDPLWSPDGRSIGFCRNDNVEGSPYSRFTVHPDGTGQRFVSVGGCGGDWQALPRAR